jgi:hypothetical protein
MHCLIKNIKIIKNLLLYLKIINSIIISLSVNEKNYYLYLKLINSN